MKTHTIERIDVESIAGVYVNGLIVPSGFISRIPVLDDTHILTSKVLYDDPADFSQVYTFDPSKSYMYYQWQTNQWLTEANANQRLNVDLGVKFVITRFAYKNAFNYSGGYDAAVQAFTFWGSNNPTSFADTAYADDTGWTQLPTDISTLAYVVYNEEELKYVTVTNTTPYQYYSFKFVGTGRAYMGVRRLELQTPSVVTVGSDFTLTPADSVCLATGTIAVTLPTAVGIAGKQYAIKNIGAGTITVSTSELIDGSSSWSLPLPFQSIIVASDGANWQITASHL